MNFQKVSLEVDGNILNIGINSKTYKKCLWKINGNILINSKSVSEIPLALCNNSSKIVTEICANWVA